MSTLSEQAVRLHQLLQLTLSSDPASVATGEKGITAMERESGVGYSMLLVQLLNDPGVAPEIKLVAAISFKNHITKHWSDSGKIPDQLKTQIKSAIVTIMLAQPIKIQSQLSAAVTVIANNDFPDQWQQMLPELVSKFASSDLISIKASLHTISSIFKRYEIAMKSNEVLEELLFILKIIQEPLLALYTRISQILFSPGATSAEDFKNCFIIVRYTAKIFYFLNCVDLPEYFEDHMSDWFNGFHQYLCYNAPAHLASVLQSDTSAGLLLKLQAQICHCLNVYIEKYEEEFTPFLPTFMQDVWTLLMKTDDAQYNDPLVTSAIKFLTTTACSTHHTLFAKQEIIQSVCANIVRPNIKLRESDEELFEDDPREFIRMDMEGSDTNTRRRAALELVKGLRRNFEREVTAIFERDIASLLQEYGTNPKANWKSKDVAIYLIAALAVKGGATAHGLSRTNELVPILEFYKSQVLPDICNKNAHAIIRADCIKFIYMFRAQLVMDTTDYQNLFTTLTAALQDSNIVVKTYAAAAVERFLILRDVSTIPPTLRFTKEFLQPFAASLLVNLSQAQQQQNETARENEYLMQAIMRILAVLKEGALPYADNMFKYLLGTLSNVCQNIRNPLFNHYLWEAIAVLMRNVLTAQPSLVANVENHLLPIIQQILSKDITEFAPYAFQVLSLLIEMSPSLNPTFLAILPSLLTGQLWQRSGNIPALVRLLSAFMRKSPKAIADGRHIEPILGIFQTLLPSGATDVEAFNLLEAVISYLEPEVFGTYMRQVFTLVFQRLASCKTYKINKAFVGFLSLYIFKYGAQSFVSLIEQIQPSLYLQVIQALFVGNAQKLKTKNERKLCVIAATKLACDLPALHTQQNAALFVSLVSTAHALLVDTHVDLSGEQEDNMGVHEITSGASTSFHRLAFASKFEVDHCRDIDDEKFWAESVARVIRGIGGAPATAPHLAPLLTQQAPPIVTQNLVAFISRFNLI